VTKLSHAYILARLYVLGEIYGTLE
jgi:hypothetical protein